MVLINGFATFLGRKNTYPYLINALQEMSHRAWAGYLIEGKKSIKVKNSQELHQQSLSAKSISGYCLATDFYDKEDTLIHGTIYGSKGTHIGSRIKHLGQEPSKLAEFLRDADGEYTFSCLDKDKIVFGRDPLGVKPLFIGRREGVLGVATDSNALRAVGMETEAVSPGFVYSTDLARLDKFVIKSIEGGRDWNSDANEGAENVLRLLNKSIKTRIKGKNIAIGFSGGLDSSLLAHLASKISNIRLISVFTPGSIDEYESKASAASLGLDLIEICLSKERIKQLVTNIFTHIERKSPMDLSIGVVVNEIAFAARKEGCNTIILGQLADELFGGYMKYLKTYEQKGYEESQSMMMHDIKTAYKANFQRDEAAASFFTELRLPYASFDLANYAITLHPSLKMNIEKNSRKIVLREAALRAGLPENIVFKPKKAMQYSSKIQKYIQKMRL